MSASLLNNQDKNLTARTNVEKTDLMVLALIHHVTDTRDSQSLSDPEAPGVLLDTKMEGVRCLLVRLPPQPQSEGATAQHAQVMLSPREEEIARMVAAGYPNKTIAAVLDISSWTVGTHLRRVFAKLGVGSRAAMVARLLEEGSLRNPARHP
jgi:DNA-binding CsgD family transcriptional regulator